MAGVLTEEAVATMRRDGPDVGTERIFSSPNAWTTAGAPAPVPTPSVYEDARGEIHNVLVGGRRVNLLHTRKGVMRSGDFHRNTQNDFVFAGAVEVWTMRSDGGTDKRVYRAHEFISIPAGVPHIFNFIEDCVLAEWWEPFGTPFGAWFYRPYRALVDASFIHQSSDKPGKLVTLQPAQRESAPLSCVVALLAGAGIGLAAGLLYSRRAVK
jgi:hypothetical protein